MSSESEDEPSGLSVAIPNFNYGRFIGKTLESVLQGTRRPSEVVVSDNASTDDSESVIRSVGGPEVRLSINDRNLGFAPNLDKAVEMTTFSHVTVLHSDDMATDSAVEVLMSLLERLQFPQDVMVTCGSLLIDSAGKQYPRPAASHNYRNLLLTDIALSRHLQHRVFRVDPRSLLGWSLANMRNPLPFLGTVFPREIWKRVGGYLGARTYNPDLWFHWRALCEVSSVIVIDEPLFAYRWHGENQEHQSKRHGTLRYLVDQYLNCSQLTPEMLDKAAMSEQRVKEAFVRKDIIERSVELIRRKDAREARRYLRFGRSVMPQQTLSDPLYFPAVMCAYTPGLGRLVADLAYRSRTVQNKPLPNPDYFV